MRALGPVTLSPILLSNGPEHPYTILNENPKLQPNPSAQSETLPLPMLLRLTFNPSSVVQRQDLAVILDFHYGSTEMFWSIR